MEIYLDKRAVRQIRLSAQEAIDEGDLDALRESVLGAFTDDQVEDIERLLDADDFYEFLSDVLSDWGGDDVDELFELLESQFGEVGIGLKYKTTASSDDDEPEEDDDDESESELDEELEGDLDEELGEDIDEEEDKP
jgi:hypothetical protein